MQPPSALSLLLLAHTAEGGWFEHLRNGADDCPATTSQKERGPLAGVWSTMPREVRLAPYDAGLGDRVELLLLFSTLVKLGLWDRVVTCWHDGSIQWLQGESNRAAVRRGVAFNVSVVPYPIPITDHIEFPPELHFVTCSELNSKAYRSLPLLSYYSPLLIDCKATDKQGLFPVDVVKTFCTRTAEDLARHHCARNGLLDSYVNMIKHPAALAYLLRELWPSTAKDFKVHRVAAAVRCAHRVASRQLKLVSPAASRVPQPPFAAFHIRRGERGVNRCGLRYVNTPLCKHMLRIVADADAKLDASVELVRHKTEFKNTRWYIASDDTSLVAKLQAKLPTIEVEGRPAQRGNERDQGLEDILEFFALSRAHTILANYVERNLTYCGDESQYLWHHSEYTFAAAYVGEQSNVVIPSPPCCTKVHYVNAYAEMLGLPPEGFLLLNENGRVQKSQTAISTTMMPAAA